jgi:hypothetical protein
VGVRWELAGRSLGGRREAAGRPLGVRWESAGPTNNLTIFFYLESYYDVRL